jgi:hypothetical protein
MTQIETAASRILSRRDQARFLDSLEIAYPSENSTIYRFSPDSQRPFLLKVFKPQSRHIREIEGTPAQKVAQLQLLSYLIEEYYGAPPFVRPDYYLLDHITPVRISALRPEIIGTPADQLPIYSAARIGAFEKKTQWDELWSELVRDSRFLSLNPVTQKNMAAPDFSLGNMIFQAPELYFIIDW